MKRRSYLFALFALVAALAAATAVGGARPNSPPAGTIAVLGSYSGPDQQSFRAVLDGFTQQNPGVRVTFTSAGDRLETVLIQAMRFGIGPDLAVLSLPAQASLMQTLASTGALKPTRFVSPALDANYAFAWKRLGSVNGILFGLSFKATNESAFWFDRRLFENAGVQAPRTWDDFQRVAGRLLNAGTKPFAIAGADGQALTDLFENIYLGQQGQARYERLARHEIRWTHSSVKDALKTMRGVLVNPSLVSGGLQDALKTDFPTAVMKVFGTPPKAAMVFGGSTVLPVLRSARAARPLNEFGVFAFPLIGKPPARVIGRADVVVMLKDSPAARSLVQYLATPGAATIWAKRGGFLSPNRKVDPRSYSMAASRALASVLTRASAFRLGLSEQQPESFSAKVTELLQEFARNPSKLNQIADQLEAEASRAALKL